MKDKLKPTYEELKQRLTEADAIIAGLGRNKADVLISDNNAATLRMRDLEETLKRSEQNFRNSMDNSPLGIRIVSASGETLYANQAVLDIYGYESIEELKANSTQKRYTTAYYTEHQMRKEKRQRGEYVPSEYEIGIVRKNGETRYLRVFRKEVLWNGQTQFQVLYNDITESKKAEKALQKSQKFVSSLLENAPHPTVVINPDTSVRYVNPAWERLNGWTLAEVVGLKAPYPWWPEGLKEMLLGGFQAAMKQGSGKGQVIAVKKNGEYYWIDMNWASVTSNGEFQYLLINSLDITERRQLEEQLEKQYQEYRVIIDSAPVLIFYKDKEGKFLRVNKAFATALDIPEKQFLGKTVFDLYSSKIAQGMTNDDRDVLESGKPKLNIVEQYESASGLRWVQTDKVPILGNNGKATALIGFAQDITERKQAEEELRESQKRFQALVETTSDFIWEMNLNGVYTYCSPQIERLWGFKPEEMLGKTPFDLLPPEDREQAIKAFSTFLRSPSPFSNMEMRSFDSTGRIKFLEISSVPFYDMAGKQCGYRGITRDITERKQAQQALRESEEKFSIAFRESPDLIAIMNLATGQYIEANDNFTRVTGYSREELIGHSFDEVRMWVYPEEERRMILLLEEQGRITNDEYTFRTKSGELRQWLCSAEIISIGGEPCSIAVATDITERKKMEQALRESEEKFSRAFHSSPAIIAITTLKDGRYIDVNDSYIHVTGYTREELIGRKTRDINIWARLEDRSRLFKILVDKNGVKNEELDFRMKSGEIRTWLFSAEPINIGGEQCLISVSTDITELKQAEQALKESQKKYSALVEHCNDGIVIVQDAVIKYANPKMFKMIGSPLKEAPKKPFIDFISPEYTRLVSDTYQKRMAGEIVPAKYEFDLINKEGGKINVETSASIIEYDGKPADMAIIRDITERKMMEEEQQKLSKLESIGILAGGIAHDFNNLLTVIMGNIGLARRYVEPQSKAYERLDEAEKASVRAKDLTQQLLTFSKGGAPIKETAIISELIKETAVFSLRGSDIRLELSLPEDLWALEIDKGQISQVIQNIVINADEAMPDGGTLHISARNITIQKTGTLPLAKGKYVQIELKDEGIGMSRAQLARLFEPYYTTKQKGSGLGLATAYSIITNHDGYITAESIQNAGTTFYVYLPASSKPLPVKKKLARERIIRGKSRILVMDDEEIIRAMLVNMLTIAGYYIETSDDGAEAIELYRKAREVGQPFDAVILDLTVPGGMGGKESIKKLLEIDPEVKAIVSSGYATDPIMSEYKKYGFSAVVAKPYNVKQMEEILRDVLTDE